MKVNPEGKYVVDIDKDIDVNKCTPNTRVALRNDSYVLHKILPTKVQVRYEYSYCRLNPWRRVRKDAACFVCRLSYELGHYARYQRATGALDHVPDRFETVDTRCCCVIFDGDRAALPGSFSQFESTSCFRFSRLDHLWWTSSVSSFLLRCCLHTIVVW